MKKLTALCLSLLLALFLCACGGDTTPEETTDPATTPSATETKPDAGPLGKNTCTSIVIAEDKLDGGENWLELESDTEATLFMEGEEFGGTYTLTDGTLSVTFDDLGSGTGTLSDGSITLELLGMICTFDKNAK